MELLSMILADHEPIFVKKLLETYDWNSMGFRIVGAACSGEDAWKMIQGLQPDLVLTDVRITTMDGLALIDKVKETGWETECVVLSESHEFEYVQKACQKGALSYLVKPFEEEDLIRTMSDVYELCLERKKNKNDTSFRESVLLEHQEQYLEKSVEWYLEDRISASEMAELLQNYRMEELLNDNFVVIQAGIDTSRRILNQKEYEIKLYLMEAQLKRVLEKQYTVWMSRRPAGTAVYIVHLKNTDGVTEELRELLFGLRQDMKSELIAVISLPEQGLEGMKHAFLQTTGLYDASCAAGAVIMTVGDSFSDVIHPQYSFCLESQIVSAIRRDDKHQMKKAYERFVFLLTEEESAVAYMHRLAVNIEIALGDSRMLTDEMRNSFRDFYLSLHNIPLLKLVNVLYQLLVTVIEQKNASGLLPAEEYMKDTIDGAITYIGEHLDDEKLSISKVADSISMNPVYFGRMFTKMMNMSFKRYILNLRMEKAKELLRGEYESLEEICQKTGISDSVSFSRMFEDCTGMLPEEYK